MSARRKGPDVRSLALEALHAVRQKRAAENAAAATAEWTKRETALRQALASELANAANVPDGVGDAEVVRIADIERVVATLWGFLWWTERMPGWVGERLVVALETQPGVYAAGFLATSGGHGLERLTGLERLGLFIERVDGEQFGPRMTKHVHGAVIHAPSLAHLITEVAVQAAKLG